MGPRTRVLAILTVLATGCSALINPDVGRLGDEDDAGATGTDSGMVGADAGPDFDGGPGDDGGPGVDGGGTDAGPVCPPSCADTVDCTDDGCESGSCVHTPNDSLCGGGERCNPVLGCVPNRCTRNEECDDGLFCNGAERCDPSGSGTGCVAGDPPDCGDAFSCTGDSCNEDVDACVHAPNDALCGDTIDCTMDRCAPADSDDPSGCVHEADDAFCNTAFCTTGRTCNPTRGCRGGRPRDCSDANVCTADTCEESSRMCVSTPRDADGDGYPAETVTDGGTIHMCGGTDCNDGEGSINPGAMESCNGVDDNCNGTIDEGCPTSLPEDCGSAQPIVLSGSGAGSVSGRFDTLMDDYQTSPICRAPTGGRDAVYYVDLPRGLSDVTIDTIGSSSDTVLGIGFSCDAAGLQIACNDDFDRSMGTQSRIWLHRIGSGTSTTRVYILVDGYRDTTSGDFVVNVQRRASAPDSCSSIGGTGPLDISGGGTVVGYVDGFVGTQNGTCASGGPVNQPEAIFRVTGPGDGTMGFNVLSTDFTPNVYLRARSCTGSEVGCATGASIGGGVNGATLNPTVTAGDPYYFFVDGGRGGYAVYYTP